jgi:hypothetical protein
MGILLFVLLVVLIATFGFWDTLAAILGATALVVLAVLVGLGALALAVLTFLKRAGGRAGGRAGTAGGAPFPAGPALSRPHRGQAHRMRGTPTKRITTSRGRPRRQ